VPEQRTRVREQGLTGARNSNAEFILSAICSAITSGGKPANARLVAAASATRVRFGPAISCRSSGPTSSNSSPNMPSGCRMRRREAISSPSRPRFRRRIDLTS
jgi:hypothetical protein